MAERDDSKPTPNADPRPDYFTDFPEEFAQPLGGPARDLARRAREAAESHAAGEPEPDAARERIEAMRRRILALR